MTKLHQRKWHVRMVKPQFVDAILAGTKHRTIRPVPKRAISRGDLLDIRQWSGLPYRSKQIPVLLAVVRFVISVTITEDRIFVGALNDPMLMLDSFARADGFPDWPAMRDWFKQQHGLPFTGQIIEWSPLQNATRECPAI